MNYLELVQETVRESGAKIDIPTTVVGQSGLAYKYVKWVQSAWKKIQMERLDYHFRVVTAQQLAIVAGTYEYSLPSILESLNSRSLTTHVSGENEAPVHFKPSEVYRTQVVRQDRQTGRPQYFTLLPDGSLAIWPVPDQSYTLEYEGIRKIQELDMTDDTDTPVGLDEEYHEGIVWQAVMKYALHFEDGSKLQEAQAEFMPYKKYYEERYMDIPVVDTTALYTSLYYSYA